jgi:hypothetical protein
MQEREQKNIIKRRGKGRKGERERKKWKMGKIREVEKGKVKK